MGIAPHLLLFPVVSALPAPQWARGAGWGWLVVDMATDIMALYGVPRETYLALKYGGNLSAALWIAAASWEAPGAMRWIGLLLVLDLGGYSFLAPLVDFSFLPLLPSLVLLPWWIALAGRLMVRRPLTRPGR